MNESLFRKLLREEATRVLSEQTQSPIAAIGGKLYVLGKKTKVTIDAIGFGLMEDIKVNSATLNGDGTATLSLESGKLKKDITLKNTQQVKEIMSAVSSGKPYSYSKLGNSFSIVPV